MEIDDDDDDADLDDEDILADIIPTPSESIDSRSADHSAEQPYAQEEDIPEPPSVLSQQEKQPVPPTLQSPVSSSAQSTPSSSPTNTSAPALDTSPATQPTTTESSIRPRRPAPSESHTTARATLFSRRKTTSPGTAPPTTQTSTATAEAILDRQRAEQEALVGNILQYASALRDSSQRFNDTLEKDRAVLDRAADGMDRAETGIEAARRRMNVLTRMTEGKGWWGRMLLFAWVYGLMVVLVLVVFVLPKFRF